MNDPTRVILRAAAVTEQELVAWGQAIGRAVDTPAIFALRGDLGAGKSVLARAIARGAGVMSAMPSPTFNLVYKYEARRGDVMHLDLYRLDDEEDVWELGWRELGAPGEIVLIEWPERAESLLPPDRFEIALAVADESTRTVTVDAVGAVMDLPGLHAGTNGASS